jgi:hypothetical protein
MAAAPAGVRLLTLFRTALARLAGPISGQRWTFAGFAFSAIRIGSDFRTLDAARLTDKERFKIGHPDIIRPLIGADLDLMAACNPSSKRAGRERPFRAERYLLRSTAISAALDPASAVPLRPHAEPPTPRIAAFQGAAARLLADRRAKVVHQHMMRARAPSRPGRRRQLAGMPLFSPPPPLFVESATIGSSVCALTACFLLANTNIRPKATSERSRSNDAARTCSAGNNATSIDTSRPQTSACG